jgi:hypothetical protein
MRRTALVVLIGAIPFYRGCRAGMTSETAVEATNPVLSPGVELPRDDWERLLVAGWPEKVGTDVGLWVSVERQALFGVQNGGVVFGYPCSTAAKGVGNKDGSKQTPLGWHEIRERIGDGLPPGAVFDERKPTARVWTPGVTTDRDFVLTRIMWLTGLEPGVNAGPGVDSHERYIYIHGTPAEDKIGTPASMGCIRLTNQHMIEVFDQTKSGTRVLITEW